VASVFGATSALAQGSPIRVGLMLPSTGTYAARHRHHQRLQAVRGRAGRQAGRPRGGVLHRRRRVRPSKATENANKLVKRDKVDVLVGTVHSGVALAMAKVARENKTLLIVPNAGADELTGPLCAPTLFRTSFSNWQPAYAMGKVAAQKGHKKVVTLTWKYAAGQQAVEGFKEAFEKGGGKIVKEMTLPFPNVEFQPFLTEIAALKPDAVCLLRRRRRGQVRQATTPRPASRTPSRCTPRASSPTAPRRDGRGRQGPADHAALCRRPRQQEGRGLPPQLRQDLQAAARRVCRAGLRRRPVAAGRPAAANGDIGQKDEIIKAMEAAKIDSPRGTFTLSKAHNPVQDIYLRGEGGQNKVIARRQGAGRPGPRLQAVRRLRFLCCPDRLRPSGGDTSWISPPS
jgi:branched-chain amino acid transport system substrate-binding protein